MRKTTDEYVPPKSLVPNNPTKWTLISKKNPEMKYPHNLEEFKNLMSETFQSKFFKDMPSDKQPVAHEFEPMVSAVSVVIHYKSGETDFGHVSYNLLFSEYDVEVT